MISTERLSQLLVRMESCEAARDMEVEKVLRMNPIAHLIERRAREMGWREVDRLKLLLAAVSLHQQLTQEFAEKLMLLQPSATLLMP